MSISCKAQSAIEYLTTYGWALILIAGVMGVAFSLLQNGCNVEASGFESTSISINDAGVTGDGKLVLGLRNPSSERLRVKSAELNSSVGSVKRSAPAILQVGESQVYRLAEINTSNSVCRQADVRINFQKGGLAGQTVSGTVQVPAQVLEAIVKFLRIGGGELPQLEVNSSVMESPGVEAICMGADCPQDRENFNRRVDRKGDTMKGTIKTDRFEASCIGQNCNEETGTAPGHISTRNYTMNGTLKVHEVRPINQLCIGQCS